MTSEAWRWMESGTYLPLMKLHFNKPLLFRCYCYFFWWGIVNLIFKLVPRFPNMMYSHSTFDSGAFLLAYVEMFHVFFDTDYNYCTCEYALWMVDYMFGEAIWVMYICIAWSLASPVAWNDQEAPDPYWWIADWKDLNDMKYYMTLIYTYITSTPQQWRSPWEEGIFGDTGVCLQLPIPIDSQGLGVEKFHTCGFNVLWCFRILGIHMQMPLISFHFSKPLDLGNWAFASRLHIKNCRGTLVQKRMLDMMDMHFSVTAEVLVIHRGLGSVTVSPPVIVLNALSKWAKMWRRCALLVFGSSCWCFNFI